MTSFLPSELARLILGYLEENGFEKSSQTLLKEVPELAEFSKLRKQGKKINTLVGNNSLEEILMDFSATKDHVRECLKNHPATFRNVPKSASLYEQVKIITSLASCKRNRNQLMSYGRLGKGGQIPHNKWLMKLYNNSQSEEEQQENSPANQNLLMEVNTTRPESLPGSNFRHPIQVDIGKNCDQSDLHSTTSSPLGTPCNISAEFNESLPGQSTSFSVTGAYFEGTPQKRKGQAKRRSAEQPSGSSSNIESEANFEKILKNLYENTALHEKIAENINKGLNTQGKLLGVSNTSTSSAGELSNTVSSFGPDRIHPSSSSSNPQNEVKDRRLPGEPSVGDVALIKELDHIVTGIITETTSDPVFENLIEEVFGTSSNPPLPVKKYGSCQPGQQDSVVDFMSANSRPLSTPIPPLLTSDKISSSRGSNFCNMLHSPASSSSLPGFPTLDNQSNSNSQPPAQPAENNSGQISSKRSSWKKGSPVIQVPEKVDNISSVLSERKSPQSRIEESDCASSPHGKPNSSSLNVDKSNCSKDDFILSKTNVSSENSKTPKKERRTKRKQKTRDDEKKLGDQLIEEFAQFQSSRPDRVSESEGSTECEKSDVSLVGEEVCGASSPECVSSPVGKAVSSPTSEKAENVSVKLSNDNQSISNSPKGSHKKSETEHGTTEAVCDDGIGSTSEDPPRIIDNIEHTDSVPDCAKQPNDDVNPQTHFPTNEPFNDEFESLQTTDASENDSQLLAQSAPLTIKSSTIPGLTGSSTIDVYNDNQQPVDNDYYTLTNLEPVDSQGYVTIEETYQDYSLTHNMNNGGSSYYIHDTSKIWRPVVSNSEDPRNDYSKGAQPLIHRKDGICINGQLVETGPVVQQGAQISTTPSKNTTTILLPPVRHNEIDSGCVISIGVGEMTKPLLFLIPSYSIRHLDCEAEDLVGKLDPYIPLLNKMDKNMDSTELNWTLHPKQHQRVIVHIDIDCFYAQVEMVRNPELRNKPMGVKQKYLMVTSNYIARALGVKKQMYVTEAMKVLPELILIDGSDLTPYRQYSNEISSIAQTFTPHVERMGLDENFLDITDKVQESYDTCSSDIVGYFYGHETVNQVPQSDPCGCGCYRRLIVGTQIACNLRKEIFEKTGITCCAGIAHNKVLAKMVSGYRKPNQQTVIFPWQVCELMSSLDHVKSVPGIGNVTTKNLEELNISSVQDLQRTDMKILRTKFDEETCKKLKNLSYGVDEGLVRGSVRPQSLGIEDAFTVTKVTSYEIIKSKYEALLERLLKLLAEDGRIPSSLKVVVRKSDGIVKFGPRESKQIPLSGSFFSKSVNNISENTKSSLYSLIISAFHKMVEVNKPFCLTLVGLGFTKLIEQPSEKKSIAQFFKKRPHDHLEETKIEVEEQKLVKIHRNKVYTSVEGQEFQASNIGEDIDDDNCDSDGEFSVRFNGGSVEMASESNLQQKCDIASNSNLQEQEKLNDNTINLGLDDSRLDHNHGGECSSINSSSVGEQNGESSHNPSIDLDPDVFNSLPKDIQEEVLMNFKVNSMYFGNKSTDSKVPNSIPHAKKINRQSLESYFKPGLKQLPLNSVPEKTNENSTEDEKDVLTKNNPCEIPETEASPSSLNKVTKDMKFGNDCELLDSIDYDVFSALPEELQKEILDDKRRQRNNLSMQRAVGSQSTTKRKIQSSPILKYFKKL